MTAVPCSCSQSKAEDACPEAVTALIDWAMHTGEVGAILAAVADDNDPSARVWERVGGFVAIGTCRADEVVEVVSRRDL